ncbi:MAG: hypothetical protein HUU37_04150 [Bdellovibrionales bacterium]|nr:hypothetical protein [Bdellovibrionales bacterium]
MTVPLIILAVLAAAGGFLAVPHFLGGHVIPNFLENLFAGVVPESLGHGSHAMEWGLMLLSVAVATGCLWLSYWLYVVKKLKDREPRGFTAVLFNSYYLNEIYEAAFVRSVHRASVALWKYVDVRIIDAAVLLSARASQAGGRLVRTFQTGHLEHYLLVMMAGLLMLLAAFVTRLI